MNREEERERAHDVRVQIAARALAQFHFPDADVDEQVASPPLWFAYLGEADAVVTALRTKEPSRG